MTAHQSVAKAPSDASDQAPKFDILDAVKSQEGEFWVRYGDEAQSTWFALGALVQSPTEVFKHLSLAGIHLASGRSREAFKTKVEARQEFRHALVTEQAGWVADNVYRHGDGSLVGPHAGRLRRNSVIADLPREPRFTCAGTIDEWTNANAPFLIDQPLCQLIYSYVFAGYLVGLAPLDFHNPILEIVGETGRGKTSLAVGAGSVCGGDPRNPNGFCLSWDRTNGTFDKLERAHRDATLILNENNLTGGEAVQQASFMRTAIMRFTEPGERETCRSIGRPVISRLALLSTSNASITDLISGTSNSDGAMRSRVFTVNADRPFGIFDLLPAGFTSASGAVRALVANASRFYGTAGREFVSQLCRYRRDAITRLIDKRFEELRSSWIAERLRDERSLKTLTLCMVAFGLAKQFGLVPRECGSFDTLLRKLSSSIDMRGATAASSPRDAVIEYICRHWNEFIDIEKLDSPLSKAPSRSRAAFGLSAERNASFRPSLSSASPITPACLRR